MNKDSSKPISFKTIQKNKKLIDFVEEGRETKPEEQSQQDDF